MPMTYFPALAACEIAGAAGLIAGIWFPRLGVAAAAGLAIYFAGAVVSHLRVGDIKAIGAALFMLGMAVAAVALRVVSM